VVWRCDGDSVLVSVSVFSLFFLSPLFSVSAIDKFQLFGILAAAMPLCAIMYLSATAASASVL
jgi:hypothetical protein